MDKIQISLITSQQPTTLAKRFFYNKSGQLEKKSAGSVVRGEYQKIEANTPDELAAIIDSLKHNQALTYGIAKLDRSPIASRKEAGEGDITRTRDNFDWPAGGGVMFLDIDPKPNGEPLDRHALMSVLKEVWPDIETAPVVLGDSGSSHIYHSETDECLKGQGGLRCYILVADARDIPRAGEVLHKRLWLAGYGYYAVSESGALLDRSMIDAVVWQPERLDFAAGAKCDPPLEQRRPAPEALNNNAARIDTRATLPDLTTAEVERLKEIQKKEREEVRPDQEIAQMEWVETRLAAIKPEEGKEEDTRHRLNDAVKNGRLYGDFILYHQRKGPVSVGEILDDPERWHGERFADPLEPEYRGDKRIAWVNLRSGSRPYIYSHAHGGRRYTLVRASATIKAQAGEMPRLISEADALMKDAKEVYQRGGQLVRVLKDGRIHGVQVPWLRTHLECIISWLKWDGRSKNWVPTDCPGDLAQRIVGNRGGWEVPELTGVIRGPILREDGSLLDQPGYDPATGLLLMADHPDGWPQIPQEPTTAQVYEALTTLWEPFEHFPYVDDLSRGVQLAALLTAPQRPLLETAPAFGYNAYKAGTGKSKAAKATAWLGGSEPVESPWSDQPEEQRKRLMSSLMAGPQNLMLDNISGAVNSDTLCSILTASSFTDRKLGVSEDISASTKVLITLTGNNLHLVGDLARRVLVTTIDHGVENPERLAFPFDPVARVRERWLYYRAAALTVLRGFIAAGAPAYGEGRMGSYEKWDAMIRQCVCWLMAEGLTPFGVADPADAVTHNYEHDPETQKLSAVLVGWYSLYNSKPLRIAQVIQDCTHKADFNNQSGDDKHGELLEVLREIAGEPEKVNSRRLGRWIERNAGRIIDGLKFERATKQRGVARWVVTVVL